MSPIDPANPSRPLRVAGLALLGVASVAVIVGVVTVTAGGDGSANGPRTVASSASTATGSPAESPTAAGPSSTPATTTTAAAPTTTPAPSEPAKPDKPSGPPATGRPDTANPPGGREPADDQRATPRAPLRVYNNSTIKHLAARAADDFRAAGWEVVEVGNYSSGIIPTTTVYYRPGTDEKAAAEALGRQFGMRVEPRFDGISDASPGLVVIVTNDYGGR
ncbi:hypothetical protein GCM10012275_13510 [Longimycelium tulufanense]|uniref:LytR/CpsA/Psr regulator C-terminal domain-containing protein n=1 Tax=Longimycelium tulufanense TaxID=907463 RepID=A0A8J3CAE4_9PSEU|nr:LytR C-terminal domain-containing protein [Longimycelium tulufanense]GGM43793.1 hypothetical protein GCM10012275_13510 [Longimycelium tulufanense]